MRELTETIRRQERELQELRALPAKIDEERRRFERAQAAADERAAAEASRAKAAEAAAHELEEARLRLRRELEEREAAERAREELRVQLEEIANAGPIRALRLRRTLRPSG